MTELSPNHNDVVATVILETERLIMRPLRISDASRLQSLLNDKELASNTRSIPFPYPEGEAERWIASQLALSPESAFVTAILRKPESGSDADSIEVGELIGGAGLAIDEEQHRAELGYWLGRPFWGDGLCTEAVRRILDHGFQTIGLNRIYAEHLVRNPASGRVLEKVGMKREGMLRQHARKWGVFEDVFVCGMLASDWNP